MWLISKTLVKDKYSLWLYEKEDGSHYYKAFVKGEQGGVHYKEDSIKESPKRDDAFFQMIIDEGTYIASPFKPGQTSAGDGSDIEHPAYALYVDFCASMGLDVHRTYLKAYPKERYMEIQASIDIGNWLGVAYPEQWRMAEFHALCKTLTSANKKPLADVLSNLVKNTKALRESLESGGESRHSRQEIYKDFINQRHGMIPYKKRLLVTLEGK